MAASLVSIPLYPGARVRLQPCVCRDSPLVDAQEGMAASTSRACALTRRRPATYALATPQARVSEVCKASQQVSPAHTLRPRFAQG